MSTAKLSTNTFMHSLQLVQAMARMMEEYVGTPAATQADQEALGELLMDLDSVVDNLSTAYEAQRSGSDRYPSPEELEGAFENFVLARQP